MRGKNIYFVKSVECPGLKEDSHESLRMTSQRKKQVRFLATDDLNMLREVLSENSFSDKMKWAKIAENVSQTAERVFDIDSRRVRGRTQLLLDQFNKDEREALKRSGSEEEMNEKMQLLQDIKDLQQEEIILLAEKQNKADQKAKEIRKRALETLTPVKKENDGENYVTPTKRSTTANVMGYLRDKIEMEKTVKTDEIELRREEIKLERERFELDRQERLQRLQNEKQQTTMMLELLKNCI